MFIHYKNNLHHYIIVLCYFGEQTHANETYKVI